MDEVQAIARGSLAGTVLHNCLFLGRDGVWDASYHTFGLVETLDRIPTPLGSDLLQELADTSGTSR